MPPEVKVELRAKESGGRIEVEYSCHNASSEPVLLFDRMYDMQKQVLDPDWAYVEIASGRAVVKRLMETTPTGLHVEMPPVPYGREIAAGAKGEGKFALPLPLAEAGAYDAITRRGGEPREFPIREIVLALGWSPKSAAGNLPPGIAPVELDGEKLLLLPYGLVARIQKTAFSNPVALRLKATAIR